MVEIQANLSGKCRGPEVLPGGAHSFVTALRQSTVRDSFLETKYCNLLSQVLGLRTKNIIRTFNVQRDDAYGALQMVFCNI